MAATSVTVIENTTGFAVETDVTWTDESSTTDGFLVPWAGKDGKMLVLYHNTDASDAATLTIKKGNGIQGVADVTTGSIAAGDMGFIQLESGPFKNVTGDNKGKINIVASDTALKIAVIRLY